MLLDLSKIIEIPGGSVPFECTLVEEDLDFPQVVSFDSIPMAKGVIKNTAGVLELTGELEADMTCICDRCGSEYEDSIQMDLLATISEDESEEDDPDVFPLEGDCVDVDEIVRTLFLLNMDTKFLCSDDCKGLCSKCGKNLNDGPCDCRKEIDPRMAVLEQLLDKMKE